MDGKLERERLPDTLTVYTESFKPDQNQQPEILVGSNHDKPVT